MKEPLSVLCIGSGPLFCIAPNLLQSGNKYTMGFVKKFKKGLQFAYIVENPIRLCYNMKCK